MGEAKRNALACQKDAAALDTFGGRIHVKWDLGAAVTPLEQLPLFIEFLKVSGLFDAWVENCPLSYQPRNLSCPWENPSNLRQAQEERIFLASPAGGNARSP